MARLARLAVAGLPHLVAQQGHSGAPVFADEADRQAYLQALLEAARQFAVAVHAYALWPARVGLLLTPPEPAALSGLMQALGRRYGLAFNRRHGRRGTLWDGRFRAAALQPEAWCLPAMVHLEHASEPNDPAWTSRAHHLGQRRDPLVSDAPAYWALGNTPFERESRYARLLDEGLPPAQAGRLAQALRSGRPLGDAAWLAALGQATGQPVQARPRGRPRRTAD